MKLTIDKIRNSVHSLVKLNTFDFMPRQSLNLADLTKEIDKKIISSNEVQNKIAAKYTGTLEEDGMAQKQMDEYNELLQTEVEVNVKPIPFEVVEKATKTVPPQLLVDLDWLILRPADEPKEEELEGDILDI